MSSKIKAKISFLIRRSHDSFAYLRVVSTFCVTEKIASLWVRYLKKDEILSLVILLCIAHKYWVELRILIELKIFGQIEF